MTVIAMNFKAARAQMWNAINIKQKMDNATFRAHSKFGAYVMYTARRSMKSNSGTSTPGSPPYAHNDEPIKSNPRGRVKFDPSIDNVIIGPEKLWNKEAPDQLKALEYGGPSLIIKKLQMGPGRIQQPRQTPLLVPIFVRKRPFMKPAFEKELPRASYLWKNSLVGP